jgi:branched-chain amino acid transport system ATP-binding protein
MAKLRMQISEDRRMTMSVSTELHGNQEILLTVDNVTKRFGGVVAVDDCSLYIRRGTITGLIGPNGAGKTTLFNMIAGVYPPDAGRIWFEGERIDGLPPHGIFARKIVRTFQIARALKRMTVLENLLLVPAQQQGENFFNAWFYPRHVYAQEQALRERAEEILQRVKLHYLRHEYAGNLSGGQKKLLELARTMMSDATCILLDEPGAGVNPTLMQELVGHIQHLQGLGRTFLLIEHDMDLVMDICNPVIVMSHGRTLMEGTPRQVRNDPRVIEAYLGA